MPRSDFSAVDPIDSVDLHDLGHRIRDWAVEGGFQQLAITDADPGTHREHLERWLAAGYHADMAWIGEHLALRADPARLLPGALRVLCVRLDYLSDSGAGAVLADSSRAYISRYALGRDYHKLMRRRLARLAARIEAAAGGHFRACVDSAPVLERGFAEKSGLGWIGKNRMLINRSAGSWFFLGEIITDLPLPIDQPSERDRCGTCRACLDICPTAAFVGPRQLDSRRCISWLTIENRGPIPEPLRATLGNRIFGCDDCQLVCPWNRFARLTDEPDFRPRHGLDSAGLLELFAFDEAQYRERTEGSALRRTGYEGWLRNIAVALGNAPGSEDVVTALTARADHPSALVREHVRWALERHGVRTAS